MKILCTIGILLIANSHLFATWSIIIIDPQTKEIGIAGASCTHNCYGIGEILPGVGAIIVQAMSNNDARERNANDSFRSFARTGYQRAARSIL